MEPAAAASLASRLRALDYTLPPGGVDAASGALLDTARARRGPDTRDTRDGERRG